MSSYKSSYKTQEGIQTFQWQQDTIQQIGFIK